MLQQHGGQTVWILLKQSRPRILDTLEHDQGRIHGAVESWRRAIQSVLFLVIAFQLISSFLHSSLLYKVCSSWYHECRTSWYKYLLFATVKSRTMKCNSNCSHAATNQNSNPKNPKSPKTRHTKSDGATIATPFTWDIRSPLRKAGWYCSPNGAVPNLTEAKGNDELIEQTKPY